MSEEQQAPVVPVELVAPQLVAESSDLAAQLEAVKAKNAELISERRKDRENRENLQKQLDGIQQAQEQAKTTKLAESGEYKTLWEEAQKTVAELKQQLNTKESEVEQIRQGFTQEQLRAGAISQLSQGKRRLLRAFVLVMCMVYTNS